MTECAPNSLCSCLCSFVRIQTVFFLPQFNCHQFLMKTIFDCFSSYAKNRSWTQTLGTSQESCSWLSSPGLVSSSWSEHGWSRGQTNQCGGVPAAASSLSLSLLSSSSLSSASLSSSSWPWWVERTNQSVRGSSCRCKQGCPPVTLRHHHRHQQFHHCHHSHYHHYHRHHCHYHHFHRRNGWVASLTQIHMVSSYASLRSGKKRHTKKTWFTWSDPHFFRYNCSINYAFLTSIMSILCVAAAWT